MTNVTTEDKFPSAADFFLSWPLYRPISIKDQDAAQERQMEKIQTFWGPLNAHCSGCGAVRTFQLVNECPFNIVDSEYHLRRGTFNVEWYCTHTKEHILLFVYRITGSPPQLVKVGQFPSPAEMMYPQVAKYKELLGPFYSKFRSGIKVMADGSSIGAYVYFRRIVEFLIDRAHDKAVTTQNWDEKSYKAARVEGKIKSLSHFLPDFIVKNSFAYSILSLGIHSLSEKECAAYCDVLRAAIEIILDEELHRQEEAKNKQKTATALNEINSRLGKQDSE